MLTARDETCLRRAIRHVVVCSRAGGEVDDLQYVFDLLHFLRPDARAIVEDETARTLADVVGGD